MNTTKSGNAATKDQHHTDENKQVSRQNNRTNPQAESENIKKPNNNWDYKLTVNKWRAVGKALAEKQTANKETKAERISCSRLN